MATPGNPRYKFGRPDNQNKDFTYFQDSENTIKLDHTDSFDNKFFGTESKRYLHSKDIDVESKMKYYMPLGNALRSD